MIKRSESVDREMVRKDSKSSLSHNFLTLTLPILSSYNSLISYCPLLNTIPSQELDFTTY